MKIEQQVCTYEQGLKLKQLGIKADSYFTWMECLLTNDGDNFLKWWAVFRPNDGEFDYMSDMQKPEGYEDEEEFETDRECSAYTVAELCQMLPAYYLSWRFPADGGEKWIATVIASPKPPGVDDIHTLHEFDRYGDTQAEALATLLIALLETGAVTIEEVNSKIK